MDKKKIYIKTYNRLSYFHFLIDNLFVLYCFLCEKDMIGKSPIIICDRKGYFDGLYSIFTNEKIIYGDPSELSIKIDHMLDMREHVFYRIKGDVMVFKDFPGISYMLRGFKEHILRHLAIRDSDHSTERTVTVIKRRNNRVIVNHDEVMCLLEEKYNDCYEVYLEDLNFQKQIELMKRTSVLIGAHGAGLTNMIFLEKDASVIELTPYGWHMTLFQNIAEHFEIKHQIIMGVHDRSLYNKPSTGVLERLERKSGTLTIHNSPILKKPDLFFVRDQNIRIRAGEVLKALDERNKGA